MELARSAPKSRRFKHAAARLNAAQWYQIAEMHLRHHLRQLTRAERALGFGLKESDR